ncbi:hypothetical protein PR202_ga04311 [Eleusine coracana subsp. coracana]|uniref:Uncharacterized protein n=1 Tax=Eleusine coracana subsp. coracana TaxID=191504 RepID=A0AAV5BQL4_ELECO|nr:hypothetical protein PR202_ga04311 [Eleusine coracana subsp. coracana]
MYLITGHYLILKAIRTFASKKTQRKGGNFQNKSKGPTFISEEASSVSEGSAGTILQVNSKDVDTSNNQGAPRSAVLQACTLTSGLLLVGGLVLRQASHFGSLNGWPIADPSDVSCKHLFLQKRVLVKCFFFLFQRNYCIVC